MKKRTKSKSKAKTKANIKSKTAEKTKKVRKLVRARKAIPSSSVKKVVRIMGRGQFYIDSATLKKLTAIDDSLVELVASEKADDGDFRAMLAELNYVVTDCGKAVERGEVVRSDIILPSTDLPIDEAKKMFRGGVIPN